MKRLVPEGIDEDATLSKNVNEIRHILGWDEQVAPTDKELMINRLARMLREESKLIKSDAEDFSG